MSVFKYDFSIKESETFVYCPTCREKGVEYSIEYRPNGVTDRFSTWGPGIPMEKRVCTGCGGEDGPWVSAVYVGDGW